MTTIKLIAITKSKVRQSGPSNIWPPPGCPPAAAPPLRPPPTTPTGLTRALWVIYDLVVHTPPCDPFHISDWPLCLILCTWPEPKWRTINKWRPNQERVGRRGPLPSQPTKKRQQMWQRLHWNHHLPRHYGHHFNKSKVIYVTVAGQGYFNWNVIEKHAIQAAGLPPSVRPCWWRHFALRTDDGGDQRTSPIINQSHLLLRPQSPPSAWRPLSILDQM